MKINKNLSLDIESTYALENLCKKNDISFSKFINLIISDVVENTDKYKRFFKVKDEYHEEVLKIIEPCQGYDVYLDKLIRQLPVKYPTESMNTAYHKRMLKKYFDFKIKDTLAVKITYISNHRFIIKN